MAVEGRGGAAQEDPGAFKNIFIHGCVAKTQWPWIKRLEAHLLKNPGG